METMRDYFEKFREVERIIEDTKKEIAALEQIEQRYRVIENLRRQLDLGGYMVQRAQWELQQAKLAQKSKEKEEAGEALEELVRRIEDYKERQRALEESIAGIKQEIAENEAFKENGSCSGALTS